VGDRGSDDPRQGLNMRIDLSHYFPEYIPVRLDVGCGQRVIPHCISVDMNPELSHMGVVIANVDDEEVRASFPMNHFENIECSGCLNEFTTDVVTMMNWFWDLLKDGGILRIAVAVVDISLGAFRDPIARRYLHSDWIQYFFRGGNWQTGGGKLGLGFHGEFELVSNEIVLNERQIVVFRARK